MSTVLDPVALEGSPLADLHAIADSLGVDGYRRMRKADLIDAIVAKQSGAEPAAAGDDASDEDAPKPARRRRSRGGRGRSSSEDETSAAVEAADRADEEEAADEPPRGRGRRRGGAKGEPEAADTEPKADETVEGVIELQGNGSGFVRRDGDDADVYVSAAQIKRCELVSGDRVGGPVRPPRRSERFPSLVRVDTINGKPADEVAGEKGTRFDELKATFPADRLALSSDDATVTAVEWLTPFGKGSRVVVSGGPLAGKSELLRRIAAALPKEGLEVSVVLAGARPEEAGEWDGEPAVAPLGTSADTQGQAVEAAVEQGRRVAARGGDAVVLIDSLDGVAPAVARRALAAARNLVDGGSLTVIAAVAAPLGGETTVIHLDQVLTGLRRFPNVDLARSLTMRPELLVGDEGAEKIAQARAEAVAAARG